FLRAGAFFFVAAAVLDGAAFLRAGAALLAAFLRAGAAFFFCFAAAFVRGVPRPTTVSVPGPGTMLDSSPDDQRTLIICPRTPVITPARGSWPTFRDARRTRSPTFGIATPPYRGPTLCDEATRALERVGRRRCRGSSPGRLRGRGSARPRRSRSRPAPTASRWSARGRRRRSALPSRRSRRPRA